MSNNILIIKLGALGDVIRTTPLLRVLGRSITWVTSTKAMPLLLDNPHISRLLAMDAPGFRLEQKYDVVINLEDDIASAELAAAAAAGPIIGPYFTDAGVTYDSSSSEWFDMSLSSRLGRQKADELKKQNRKTYQEMVFAAVGKTFSGEDAALKLPLRGKLEPGLVGIEERAGNVWPSKRWNRYRELARRLEAQQYRTKFLQQRESVIDYADDISECEFIICGDTLAMHIALALGRKVVALFTCTSPSEIYGYGKLAKVVSPLLERHFYRREYSEEAVNAITLPDVEAGFRTIAGDPADLCLTPAGRVDDES